jgi:outer membrane receptor protein involved in Fe transport
VIGPRWSADGTLPGGLRELPSGVLWDLRLSWRLPLPAGLAGGAPHDGRRIAEIFLRADNLLDERVDHQTGLPAPGRTVRGGLRAAF